MLPRVKRHLLANFAVFSVVRSMALAVVIWVEDDRRETAVERQEVACVVYAHKEIIDIFGARPLARCARSTTFPDPG